MRALELHAHAKQVQRSAGQSSVAAAAYRAGEKLYDERTDVTHDYTRKQGVEHTRIYLPDNAPESYRDRETLWNAAEKKENRSNSCTAHELEISFPYEFNIMQRREAGDALARELMRRYGSAVDICFHAPNKNNDERNFHAHILFTSRGFDSITKDGWAKTKFRNLSNDKVTINGEKTTKGKQEVLSLRQFSAGVMNNIAKRDGLSVKVEHLSFKDRGIDKEPQVHLGPVANDMEKKGMTTERGDQNTNIVELNNKTPDPRKQVQGIEYETFDEFAGAKRAELQKWVFELTEGEGRRRDRESIIVEEKVKNHFEVFDKKIFEDIQLIENRLSDKGLKGAIKKVTGEVRKDKEKLSRLHRSLETSEIRKVEFRDKENLEIQIKQEERRKEFQDEIRRGKQLTEKEINEAREYFQEDESDGKGDQGDSKALNPTVGKTTYKKVKAKVAKKREIAEKVDKPRNDRKPSYSGPDIKYKKKQTLKDKHSQAVKSKGETDMDRRGSKPEHNFTPPRGPSLGR